MARQSPGFYNTIEYIGPRPRKPKRQNPFGGWVIILIAVGIGIWFGRPLVPFLKATQESASVEQAEVLISTLESGSEIGQHIAAEGLKRANSDVVYDPAYYRISYPNGDIAPTKGAAADVVIRSLRGIGVDLQQEVHKDMVENFRLYPQLWAAMGPDTNIDHRRIPNLQRYFERHGESLTTSRASGDYRPGDIVVWSLANADKHIGIIVPGPGTHVDEPWVVHNIGTGVKWENILFEYKVEAHFRYPTEKAEASR